jgi:hypothetical protein
MGLFASVIHVRTPEPKGLRGTLDAALLKYGLRPYVVLAVPPEGPRAIAEFEALRLNNPSYLLSTRGGPWLTVIEASFAVDGTPWLSELAVELGKRLDTYTLSLMVHDDDVLFYNLDRAGEPLDGYNSFPQYFEKERLSEREIEDQRHTPMVFRSLVADEGRLRRLQEVLDRGWWRAHDSGQLDDDGLPTDDDGFPLGSEGERMAEVGDVLGIPGDVTPYPYAEWLTSTAIDWRVFEFVAYARKREAG